MNPELAAMEICKIHKENR
jgi:hypothetical protein